MIFWDTSSSTTKKGQNTQTALLKVLEDVRLAVEKRNVTSLGMFDFSKAFDCISRKLLLQKLYKMGKSGNELNWYDRTQAVKARGRAPIKSLSLWPFH